MLYRNVTKRILNGYPATGRKNVEYISPYASILLEGPAGGSWRSEFDCLPSEASDDAFDLGGVIDPGLADGIWSLFPDLA